MPVTSTYSRSSPRSPYGYSDMLRLHGANKVACEQHQQHYRSSTYTAGYQYYTAGTANTAVSYIHTDFQGSWVLLTDAAGQAVAHQAFDAWGRPRNPLNWAPLPEGQGISMPGQRGYTGHEHLPSLGLIHMNGRVYAPSLQRFLSPDPVLQAPANAQSHNRYAYCLNNPLRYTDPSGYIHAPAVPRWPEGYDPPDHVDDPWGGSSGWARAMTPGMTYGWWAGLPAAAYGPAYYAYFGSDGSRNAPPSSHFDHVYGAGGERGRVEWKYRWESKPGKIQADGGIEVIGYKEWYVEWTPATVANAVNNTASPYTGWGGYGGGGYSGGGAGGGDTRTTPIVGTKWQSGMPTVYGNGANALVVSTKKNVYVNIMSESLKTEFDDIYRKKTVGPYWSPVADNRSIAGILALVAVLSNPFSTFNGKGPVPTFVPVGIGDIYTELKDYDTRLYNSLARRRMFFYKRYDIIK